MVNTNDSSCVVTIWYIWVIWNSNKTTRVILSICNCICVYTICNSCINRITYNTTCVLISVYCSSVCTVTNSWIACRCIVRSTNNTTISLIDTNNCAIICTIWNCYISYCNTYNATNIVSTWNSRNLSVINRIRNNWDPARCSRITIIIVIKPTYNTTNWGSTLNITVVCTVVNFWEFTRTYNTTNRTTCSCNVTMVYTVVNIRIFSCCAIPV